MPRFRARLALLSLLALAACARAPGDCLPLQGWEQGRDGRLAIPGCRAEAYAEAHRLGASLYALRYEQAALERELPTLAAEQQGPLRRRQRQLQVDIDAIESLARINGWPLQPR